MLERNTQMIWDRITEGDLYRQPTSPLLQLSSLV